jgi:RNA polymerase sigma-70 factor (family 1)
LGKLTAEQEKKYLNDLKKDSEEAFNAIYEAYFDELFLYAYQVLKQEDQVKDLLQDLFISFWKARHQLLVHTSLKNYLYTANRNLVLTYLKKKNFDSIDETQLERRIWGGPEPDNILVQKEILYRSKFYAEQLPDRCRDIYKMSREDGFSNKKIAEILGISEKTVENQLTIGLRKLRQMMGYLLLWFIG